MKILRMILGFIAFCLLVSACEGTQSTEILEIPQDITPIIQITVTDQANPATIPPSPVEIVRSPVPQTRISPMPSLTITPPDTSTPVGDTKNAITINHDSLELFDQIPDEYITSASEIRLIVRGASVEDNIRMGLECLWGNYPNRRPTYCFDFHNIKYDPSNWDFQFRANPGWIDKVTDYISATDEQIDHYDAFSFVFGYVDGQDGSTYLEISNPDNFKQFYIEKIEALEAAHPDKTFIMWTMSLARQGFSNTQNFNNMVRSYASEKGKILLDIADIESHDLDGKLVTNESGYEVIYQGYTNEKRAGHLNDMGSERMAKAVWILMARIAGWDGLPK